MTLFIISYFLIGFVCAVVYEVRTYRPDAVMSVFWVAFWAIFLPFMCLSRSIEFCALAFQKQKRADKTVVHHPTL